MGFLPLTFEVLKPGSVQLPDYIIWYAYGSFCGSIGCNIFNRVSDVFATADHIQQIFHAVIND